jgi:hypothetical protein
MLRMAVVRLEAVGRRIVLVGLKDPSFPETQEMHSNE